ncbi:hypothetical protein AX16_002565 [Volvariella volvacea WC 439]|nr:hypothetical protein AX16_002565 [Volvariella volvacea WC 439]
MDQPPPQLKPAVSDAPPVSQGPIPHFDAQIRYLTDSYLTFFQERKRIEEIYVESLLRLHRRIKQIDASLDGTREPSTTRSAWNEIRENAEREAQTRQAFLDTLVGEVINPLNQLKETQERTRKRIKEDLKDSTTAYNEYAELMLPKLKARYLKKYSEVEEQRRAIAAPTPTPAPPNPDINPLTHTRSNPSAPSRPQVTSPQPLRALDRRPSGSAPSGRARSPSSSGAFSDLAHQGKRQLNQLIGFLDNKGGLGGAMKESLVGREGVTQRTVRNKREAEEADKEYRKGVHWLETLRLNRTRVLESGYKSLETFVEESATVVRRVLERYTDNMIATTSTQTQLSNHARSVVDRISPGKDLERIQVTTPKSLASAIPPPILYVNGAVGECKDLIFGFSLIDYATTKQLPDGAVPKIVRICIEEIDKRGLEMEGIYRVSGRHAVVHNFQHEIERDEDKFELTPQSDIFAVASLLKLYLRELPEPVFRFTQQDRVQHTNEYVEHRANNFAVLRSKIKRLPPVHQATLKAIVEHLSRVVAFSERNKMDAKNIAIVFGGVIFGEEELPKAADLLTVQTTKDTVMEDLIYNTQTIFNDREVSPQQSSPPLPPTPLGEPATPYPYGSKTTRVATVPPASLSQPQFVPPPPPPPPPPQDFTPSLPPRPANSIHPSARGVNPTSPVRGDFVPPPPPPPLSLRPGVNISGSEDTHINSINLFMNNKQPEDVSTPDSPSTTAFETDEGSTSFEMLTAEEASVLLQQPPNGDRPLTPPPGLPPLPPKSPTSGQALHALHRRIKSHGDASVKSLNTDKADKAT